LTALAGSIAVAATLPTAGVGSSTPQQRAQQLTHENSVLASRSRASVLTLYSLDSRLANAQAQLASLQAQAQRLARQRRETTGALRIARATFGAAQQQLANRLRAVYEQGDSDTLSIVLGAKTIDDALSGIETMNAAAASDKAIVAQARTSRARYRGLAQRLAARANRLAQLQATVAATARSLASARAERLAYIRQVSAQRSLNAAQIGSLEAQAEAIRQRANELAVESTTAPTAGVPPAGEPAAAGSTLTVTATAYTLQGRTATGAPVGYGVVAVDPSVIPLGTRMTIPGYGEGVAADTGGSVQGATIDLWFPTAAAAAGWGRRTVTITLH
jgi:3D (Asp-Asp-Asp) domain-containing protein